ncbi:MAG: hypothetical protein DI534_09170 [Leifsonia xyli]|nr:MAG: hypothetical protein DI534_09170 [Leifsonia xyli]
MHGDGGLARFIALDPFGQPIDPTTGQIGTTTTDDAVPDTIGGSDADYAWVGGARKLYEHHGNVIRRYRRRGHPSGHLSVPWGTCCSV